jgi:type IV pilus assembly protein PilA
VRMLHKGQKGFTLIELLVVIAILGVLAAVVIPNLAKFIGTGTDEAARTELSIVHTAMTAYLVDGNYPLADGDFALSNLNPYLVNGADGLGWEYTITVSGGLFDVEQGDKK